MNPGSHSLLKRLASSTFVLMLLALCSFEVFVRSANPLAWFDDGSNTIHQNFFVDKLPRLLGQGEDEAVLLLGASGVLFPSARCDDELYGRKTRFDKWYYRKHIFAYTHADYLQNLLRKALGTDSGVCNAAVAASVVSDDYLILKKYLASNKHPQLAVVCVAPRDFLDNTRARVDQTFTYKILADVTSLPEMLSQGRSFTDLANASLNLISSFYQTRGDYKGLLARAGSHQLGHPISLYAAMNDTGKGEAPRNLDAETPLDPNHIVYQRPTNTLEDLDGYRQMYQPFNAEQFKTQCGYMEKLLTMLNEHKVAVLVVDMPVTKENLALLPSGALQRYRSTLASICSKYRASIDWVSRDAAFDTCKDFEDSAHMNEFGGAKLFHSIADTIAAQPQLCSALQPQTLANRRAKQPL